MLHVEAKRFTTSSLSVFSVIVPQGLHVNLRFIKLMYLGFPSIDCRYGGMAVYDEVYYDYSKTFIACDNNKYELHDPEKIYIQ